MTPAALDTPSGDQLAGDDVALENTDLDRDQAAMVRRVTTSGWGLDVVIGDAGTGKTTPPRAAQALWLDAGFAVTGAALAARAAAELHARAGIPPTTTASLLARFPDQPLTARHVLVVDEAGMVGTRALARIVEHAAAAGAKVVLVGATASCPR